MNLQYTELLPTNFSPASRVWVYQANRLLTMAEALDAEQKINGFVEQWQSHGAGVTAAGFLFFGQFVVLMVDERLVTVGGCSTDSSVRFIKSLEAAFEVRFFDRTTLAFVVKNKVQLIPFSQFQYAIQNGFITEDSLYFNNLVATKEELENKWIVAVKDSWLASKISFTEKAG